MPVKKVWTPARRAALEKYIAKIQPTLRLADWTITVDWEASEKKMVDALATITPFEMSRHACIRVGPNLIDLPAPLRTQTICHELAHCHLFALQQHSETMQALLEPGEQKVAKVALNQHLETAVDHLADVFVQLVPTLTLP